MRRSDIDARLQALYDQVPDMLGCTGECKRSCGPIDMSQRERQRIREAGITITHPVDAMLTLIRTGDFACEALDAFGRCRVYDQRPLICRLWGAAEGMECPYGCVPAGGYLSRDEAADLLRQSLEIGGRDG